MRLCAIFKSNGQLQLNLFSATVKGVDYGAVFLGNEATPQFACPRDLIIISIEILAQQQEAFDAGDFR